MGTAQAVASKNVSEQNFINGKPHIEKRKKTEFWKNGNHREITTRN